MKNKVIVAVLAAGDLGRSPRMQYHAISLAEMLRDDAGHVRLIGLEGERCAETLYASPNVSVEPVADSTSSTSTSTSTPTPNAKRRGPVSRILRAATNGTRLLLRLVLASPPPDVVLVQNPPTIPTLVCALAAKWIHGSRVVIDWHNLAFSMPLPLPHLTRPVARLVEFVLAHLTGDAHLTVTHALKDFLSTQFRLSPRDISVAHDRPHAAFRPRDAASGKDTELLKRLEIPTDVPLLVTATSYTPDEDLEGLAVALALYAKPRPDGSTNPPLSLIVTGKGPTRALVEPILLTLPARTNRVVRSVHLLFLPHADYASLLASCDVGLSLHTSTSGLDLPMKVLDMFGAGLPVLAHDFACASELVVDHENGLLFNSREELAEKLAAFLRDGAKLVQEMRQGVARVEKERGGWQASWDAHVRPVIQEQIKAKRSLVAERVLWWTLFGAFVVGWVMFVLEVGGVLRSALLSAIYD